MRLRIVLIVTVLSLCTACAAGIVDSSDSDIGKLVGDVKAWNRDQLTKGKAIADQAGDVAVSQCFATLLEMKTRFDDIDLVFDAEQPIVTFVSIREVRRMMESTQWKDKLNVGCGALAVDEVKVLVGVLKRIGLAVGSGGLSLSF